MKKLTSKSVILGFLFGSVGLFVLSGFALGIPFMESILNVLAAPSRMLGAYIGGPNGDTSEVIILTAFNGILYAVLFRLVAFIFKYKK